MKTTEKKETRANAHTNHSNQTSKREYICHGLIDSHSYSIDVKQLDIREDQKTEISLGMLE